MKILTSNPRQNISQKQAFQGNKLAKLRVLEAKNMAKDYAADIVDWKLAFNIYRGLQTLGAAGMIAHPIYSILTRDSSVVLLDLFMTVSSLGYIKGSEKLHNKALKHSQILVENLQKQGFKEKEIESAIKSFISQTGDFIHSPLFLATQKTKIKAIAKGETIE